MDARIRQHYAALRQAAPAGSPLTVLHIDADHTALAAGSGPGADAVLLLAMGTRKTAADLFRHNPPRPGELENAIMVVEDEVTRARAMAARYPTLWTADPAIAELARIAGVVGNALPVEAVERLFDLLAALSQGRPAASAGIPATPDFAARLLILREFMHHLGFAEIRWES